MPILPVNYGWFLTVTLPVGIEHLSLRQQLAVAARATRYRRLYPFPGPFGPLVSFEFQRSKTVSIYLDDEGKFAGGSEG